MTELNDVRSENKINITSIGARPNRRSFYRSSRRRSRSF